MELRDYQLDSIERTQAWLAAQHCNPLVVIPTAGGKSLTIAELIKRLHMGGSRVVMATHMQELVEQNLEEMLRWWPEAPVGVCCTGLGRRETRPPIVFGTVQTMYTRAYSLGKTDYVVVDEAHRIPRDKQAMYQQLFDVITSRGKRPPVIGFTATHYRRDSGLLHRGPGALFDVVAANVPPMKLIRDGWLCPLDNQNGGFQIDVTRMKTGEHDFITSSMDEEIKRQQATRRALTEVMARGVLRKSWLIFGVSCSHVTSIVNWLRLHGVSAVAVTHKSTRAERREAIAAFRAGNVRAMVTVDIATTGLNVPRIDLIAILRPTLSTSLYIQMLGRGMRLFPGKTECLVLDFGGNIARHGPLHAPIIRIEAPITPGSSRRLRLKECPVCAEQVSMFYRTCPHCDNLFTRVEDVADVFNPVMDLDAPEPIPMLTPSIASSRRRQSQAMSELGDPFLEHLAGLRDLR